MKNWKCLVAALLCILLATCAFVSCTGKNDLPVESDSASGEPATSGDPSNNQDTPVVTDGTFPLELLANMKIVYPERASTQVGDAAKSLKDSIKNAFGYDLLATTDYLREGSAMYCELEYEILIGSTNRDDDDTYYTDMRYDDYGYRVSESGKKILIGGKNDAATVQAVTDFAYQTAVLKAGGDGVFFHSGLAKYKAGSYAVDSFRLNGAPLQSYTIVYPENGSAFEEQLAHRLSSKIVQLTGYLLPYTNDSTPAGNCEILVGKTNRTAASALTAQTAEAMNGCLAGSGTLVALYGADVQGNATAVAGLLADMEAQIAAGRTPELTVGTARTVAPTEKLSAMSFNVFIGERENGRDERVKEMILRYLPDMVGLQEVDTDWMTRLRMEFNDYYGFLGEKSADDGSFSTVMYSKARFELLESGTKWLTATPDEVSKYPGSAYYRIFTWALLKDRVTGVTSLFVNTHLDYVSQMVQLNQAKFLFEFLKDYAQYPLILTGDMNCEYTSLTIQRMIELGVIPTTDLVETLNTLPTIDWILVTNDCISVSYGRICDEKLNGDKASDHDAVYAEFTVTLPEGGVNHDFDFGEVLPVFDEKFLQAEFDKEGENYGDVHRVY